MRSLAFSLSLFILAACSHAPSKEIENSPLKYPGEAHLSHIRQLTFGGTNAEAYWSFDGDWLSFQHKAFEGAPACDQIYVMRDTGAKLQPITREARATCSYFTPSDERVIFSSTISAGKDCPPEPDKTRGYVWPIYDSYQIYSANPDGTDVRPVEPGAPRAYNAEATVCKDGSVVFTSDRDGDLDLYRGTLDSFGTMTDIKRLTSTPGYDGGAFFSQDCRKIVWRASRPKPGAELEEYQALLKQHLVKPGKLEIWTADADGSHAHQVTKVGAASFAPFFTPDAQRILFASNPRDPRGHHFDIYSIRVNGTGLERVTFSNTFDSFPMFSPDGKRIAFSSNRNASRPRETNVFVADWVNTPEKAPEMSSPNAADRLSAWAEFLKSSASPIAAASMLAAQLKTIGLETIGLNAIDGQDGRFPVMARPAKSCAKTKKAPVISASLSDPVATAAVLEAARMLQNRNACVALAITEKEGSFSEVLSTLAANKLKTSMILPLTAINWMEGNAVQVTLPEGQEAKTVSLMREKILNLCTSLALNCSFSTGAINSGAIPAFRFSSTTAGESLNATGAVQIAELVAETSIGTALK